MEVTLEAGWDHTPHSQGISSAACIPTNILPVHRIPEFVEISKNGGNHPDFASCSKLQENIVLKIPYEVIIGMKI